MFTSLWSCVAVHCLVSLASLVLFILYGWCFWRAQGTHSVELEVVFRAWLAGVWAASAALSFPVCQPGSTWCWFAPWLRIPLSIILLKRPLRFLHCEITIIHFFKLIIGFVGHGLWFHTISLAAIDSSCLKQLLLSAANADFLTASFSDTY